MVKEFNLDEYINRTISGETTVENNHMEKFDAVCKVVGSAFDKEWDETDDEAKNRKLEREKKALMGFDEESNFFKEKIKEILREKNLLDTHFPSWYSSLYEGVYAELYGLAGLAPWAYDMSDKYANSSSAKLIGDRLYCLIDGKSELQTQRINRRRREQLKRTLLLATPHERLEYGFHEVYLHNGIRITIYSGDRTKPDQDVMVFRKYVLKDLTLEKIASLGTIPFEAIELFKTMIRIGFNVIFAGQVRSGKTTFMQTWQKYENPTLEGLAIATDPETPWHKIMPEAPIMQLIADGKQLDLMTKSLLRGDNDYVLLEEMRDAAAFNLAIGITSTGTMRSKATIHDNDGINIPYKMASKIKERYGGDTNEIIAQIFKNFDYVFEFCQLPEDKSKKVLKGIIEYSYDVDMDKVCASRICMYDFTLCQWKWGKDISKFKEEKIIEEKNELLKLRTILKQLWDKNPIVKGETVIPAYYKSNREANR